MKSNLWQRKVCNDVGEELSEATTHVEEHRQAWSWSHLFDFGEPERSTMMLENAVSKLNLLHTAHKLGESLTSSFQLSPVVFR